jgi:rSAM/selenodomain-associated transferase 1
MNTNAIIVFAKNPKLGFCKTRLAKTIGDEKATAFFVDSMREVSKSVYEMGGDCFVFFAGDLPAVDSDTAKIWDRSEWRKQSDGDLGERIFEAFKSVYAMGYQKVQLIGTDCPELTKDDLKDGFNILKKKQVVYGPANDGGYYLVGFGPDFGDSYRSLFEGFEWSTSEVLDESLKRCDSGGLEYGLLEELVDVDFYEDLEEVSGRTGLFKEYL